MSGHAYFIGGPLDLTKRAIRPGESGRVLTVVGTVLPDVALPYPITERTARYEHLYVPVGLPRVAGSDQLATAYVYQGVRK